MPNDTENKKSSHFVAPQVNDALREARFIAQGGKLAATNSEHVIEESTSVKVIKAHNKEPFEVIITRSTVETQFDEESSDDGTDTASDSEQVHTMASYRRKASGMWRRDSNTEDKQPLLGDEATLSVDICEQQKDLSDGTHVVQKTFEARWAVQNYESLPEWLQDNEYLRTGHRPPLPSYTACIKSIMSVHTETGNIWTHLIGCVAFIVLATWCLTRSDLHIGFQEKFVFSFFFVGAIACLGLSCAFHTLSCHSVGAVRLFSRLDYMGISLLIIGSFIPWIYYGFYCRRQPKVTYIAMVLCLGVFAVIVSLWEKFNDRRYRTFRAGVFVSMGCSGVIPTMHFIYTDGIRPLFDENSFHWLLVMAAFYLVGALLYATRTPERFFPGKFDYIFQSHQLFHLCVVIAALTHYYGITEMAFKRLTGTCPNEAGDSIPKFMHNEL